MFTALEECYQTAMFLNTQMKGKIVGHEGDSTHRFEGIFAGQVHERHDSQDLLVSMSWIEFLL